MQPPPAVARGRRCLQNGGMAPSNTLLALAALIASFASFSTLAGNAPAEEECKPSGSAMCMQRILVDKHDAEDAKLNAAYKQAMGRLSADEQGKLRTAQRAWIKQRDKTCADRIKKEWGGQCNTTWCLNAETQCMTEQTTKRAGELVRLGTK